MKGQIHFIDVDGNIESRNITRAPSGDTLRGILGGWLEVVPLFETFRDMPCVAFCDEEGKLKGLETNLAATNLWHAQIPGMTTDYLCGRIVIVTGDEALLADL